jgi:ketosteroid isomerase-like protein
VKDALFDFYAEDVSFVHVNLGMTIGPKDVLRAQSDQFRGWNRNVTLTIENMITGRNVAVVEVKRTGEQKDIDGNWNPSNGTSVMVLEVADGKITRVLNY